MRITMYGGENSPCEKYFQESVEAFLASQEKKKNRKKKKTTQLMLHERYKAGNPEVGLLGSCLGNWTTMSCIPKASHHIL